MNIVLNGVPAVTEKTTAFSCYRGERNQQGIPVDVVVILNGFALSADTALSEGDELFIIPKKQMPPKHELEAMMAARHTPGVHQKLKSGRVAIAGLGGLGSNIAVSLARIGVGYLRLIDFDVVEPSNLNRQSYTVHHLGLPKTEALKQQITDINPFIDVDTQAVRITEQNIQGLLGDIDIVCEAFDQPTQKTMLVHTILWELPQVKIVAASGMAGFESANQIVTKRRLNNLYVCGDGVTEARMGQGLMAPRVQICAGHQANMVLRLLLHIEQA